MAGLDRLIDPVTRDYVDDGAGGTEWSSNAQTLCYHQVLGRLDEWVGDPESGSRVGSLPKKLNERTVHEAADAVRDCLEPLVRSADVAGVDVRVARTQVGRLAIDASATDAGGKPVLLNSFLPWEA